MLAVEGLRWIRQGRIVLDDLTLGFGEGTVTLLTGPNGAGKTSVLRCVAGMERRDAGTIRLDGEAVDVTSERWKSSLAMVSDDNALFPELTVAEHAELASVLAGVSREESARRTDELVGLFSLERYRDRRAGELSFGFRKRLALALALIPPVRVYLFDEPLVGLDAAALDVFRSLLALLRARRRIVVVASHIVEPLTEVADATVRMHDGRLSAEAHAPGAGRRTLGPGDLAWLE